ncbi:hypothetical protein ABRY23_13450 [Melioribacteraceae bacterium 4301-Me]|uniref:hypothetical protein n=1 Tax=Pyranulibacter aquaticus TaxID=3163344 RepID=UPI00359B023F
MGFSTLIDILGSTIIGGMLLLILLRINDSAVENTYTYGGELIVQQNLVDLVELLEYDFRKIGYCKDWQAIPDPSKAILFADSNSISFLTDVNSDGIPDTLHYYTGPTSELSSTPNPRDRILYRVVNSETPNGSNLGVTQFKIRYFNSLGNELTTPVAVPGEINTMQIDVKVENYAAYDNEYSTIFWRQIRMAARNLRNR